MIQKKLVGCALGLGLSALTLAVTAPVQAQDAMASSGMSSDAMTQPMQVTGTVLRYYVDRAGYVSAMDVQGANGVQMVRFAPGMGQRIYSTYPVGGQASVYVMGAKMGKTDSMMRYDVVGMGDTMPAAGFMMPYTVSDIDLLKAEPYIMTGAKLVQFKGTLSNVVTDDNGEVIGMVLSGVKLNNAMGKAGSMMAANTDGDIKAGDMKPDSMLAPGDKMMGDMMMGDVLVRVPREVRQINPGAIGASMRVSPLFKGAQVEVVGYPEAPRYGVLSKYGQRVDASTLVIDGRAVGAVGIPMMNKMASDTLFKLNLGGTTMSKEEGDAGMMGYRTYNPNGMEVQQGQVGAMSTGSM